jgi:hypothetical protein
MIEADDVEATAAAAMREGTANFIMGLSGRKGLRQGLRLGRDGRQAA